MHTQQRISVISLSTSIFTESHTSSLIGQLWGALRVVFPRIQYVYFDRSMMIRLSKRPWPETVAGASFYFTAVKGDRSSIGKLLSTPVLTG